jgi:hypothetical protein
VCFKHDFKYLQTLTRVWNTHRYPNKGDANKKGVLLVVTSGKDGALTGGPDLTSALGDAFVDSIVGENIAVFTVVRLGVVCVPTSSSFFWVCIGRWAQHMRSCGRAARTVPLAVAW